QGGTRLGGLCRTGTQGGRGEQGRTVRSVIPALPCCPLGTLRGRQPLMQPQTVPPPGAGAHPRERWREAARNFLPWLPWVQGLYYVLAGVWPLLNMHSFLAVTGPKTDLWLVNTVAVLLVVIGAVLLASAWRRVPLPESFLLGLGSALALTWI